MQVQTANLSLQTLPQPNIVYAAELVNLPNIPTDTHTYAEIVAKEHGLNVNRFLQTIQCESHWDPSVRSQYIMKNGTRENSWGLVQINLDDPPTGKGTVTLAQAKDPYWSIRYMADRWDEGKARAWTCWRNL